MEKNDYDDYDDDDDDADDDDDDDDHASMCGAHSLLIAGLSNGVLS